jgi:hypothetical protein
LKLPSKEAGHEGVPGAVGVHDGAGRRGVHIGQLDATDEHGVGGRRERSMVGALSVPVMQVGGDGSACSGQRRQEPLVAVPPLSVAIRVVGLRPL